MQSVLFSIDMSFCNPTTVSLWKHFILQEAFKNFHIFYYHFDFRHWIFWLFLNHFYTQIFKNIKTVMKALKLIDVNKTGLVQARELRRVLETFCLKMKDDEYKK